MYQNGLIIIKRNNYKLNIMKNIFLLPTYQPSRLAIQLDCKPKYNLQLSKIENNWTDNWEKQHIYITSDEEIKEGDWCLGMDGIFQYKGKVNLPDVELPKKVILTTDPTLIADGVQSIDDEFLKWFIENPTCEFVEVTNDYLLWKKSDKEKLSDCVKIIIPQEEPKQETLKEAAERFIENDMRYSFKSMETKRTANLMLKCVEFGANYQSESMYSDFIQFGTWLLSQDITSRGEGVYVDDKGNLLTVKDLLEQFKKK